MIEVVVNDFLNSPESKLEYPSFSEIPKKRPEHFYSVEKTGGSENNHLKKATIVVQSHAKKSMYDAADMNEKVKEAMLERLIALGVIAGVELNSDHNYTDTDMDEYRYQAVFDISHY